MFSHGLAKIIKIFDNFAVVAKQNKLFSAIRSRKQPLICPLSCSYLVSHR